MSAINQNKTNKKNKKQEISAELNSLNTHTRVSLHQFRNKTKQKNNTCATGTFCERFCISIERIFIIAAAEVLFFFFFFTVRRFYNISGCLRCKCAIFMLPFSSRSSLFSSKNSHATRRRFRKPRKPGWGWETSTLALRLAT